MNPIYLDNAATTPISEEVWTAMEPYLKSIFGNPSSTHSFGRKAKSAVETARKEIAAMVGATPGQIIFTGSGSEANNTVIYNAVHHLGIEHIVTSPIEHHAILHTVEHYSSQNNIPISFVDLNPDGTIDLSSLSRILENNTNKKTLVSLMFVNNETGTISPIKRIGDICRSFNVLFHSDMVQGFGTFTIDLQELNIDFASCSAHKFHGPKGIGFLYARNHAQIKPLIHGGSQERGHRAGTENVAGIIGLHKALETALANQKETLTHLNDLRGLFIQLIKEISPDIQVIGSTDAGQQSPKILNLCFPTKLVDDMFLFSLDLKGIAASGGSACSSGSNKGSHVINSITSLSDCIAVRFSFSKYNTEEEIKATCEAIGSLIKK